MRDKLKSVWDVAFLAFVLVLIIATIVTVILTVLMNSNVKIALSSEMLETIPTATSRPTPGPYHPWIIIRERLDYGTGPDMLPQYGVFGPTVDGFNEWPIFTHSPVAFDMMRMGKVCRCQEDGWPYEWCPAVECWPTVLWVPSVFNAVQTSRSLNCIECHGDDQAWPPPDPWPDMPPDHP